MDDLICISRIIVSSIFIYAGLRKINDLTSFYYSILSFDLITPSWGWILSRFLPGFELLAGLLLLLGFAVPIGAISILVMLISFSIALTLAHFHQREINCGCFGASEAPTSYVRMLVRNILLVLLASVTILGGMHQPFLWQLLIEQKSLTLLAAMGILAAFRLSIMIWDIFYVVMRP